jgi:hypothetical protein
MGKKLPFGSLFVLKFSLLSDSIGIYDSKYPKANNNVENSVMIGICAVVNIFDPTMPESSCRFVVPPGTLTIMSSRRLSADTVADQIM